VTRHVPRSARRRLPLWPDLARRLAVALIEGLDDHFNRPLDGPRPATLSPLREEFDMAGAKHNVYQVTLGELPPQNDVVTRTVTPVIDGVDGTPIVKAPGDPPFELSVPQGSKFTVRVVDNDGTNDSEPWTSDEMSADDTFAPAAPGAATLTALREEFDATPPPDAGPVPA
jgi:hypothetical protein